jgi:hypothetical protein
LAQGLMNANQWTAAIAVLACGASPILLGPLGAIFKDAAVTSSLIAASD